MASSGGGLVMIEHTTEGGCNIGDFPRAYKECFR